MHIKAVWKSTVLFALVAFAPRSLRAQSKSRADAAQEAFQSAIAFATDENFIAACPLLERAQDLDPSERAHYALADCREREGRIATALHHWRGFVQIYDTPGQPANEKRQTRLATARERIKALEAEVPKFTVEGKENERAIIKLFLDGKQIELSQVVELDPGEHRLIVARQGEERKIQTIVVARGQQVTRIRIEPKPQSVAIDVDAQRRRKREIESARAATIARNRALGVAGVSMGAASIIASGFIGAAAFTRKEIVDAECLPSGDRMACTPAGLAAANEGRSLGNVAVVPLVIGAAAATAGIVFIVRNPKVTATVGINWTNHGPPMAFVNGVF